MSGEYPISLRLAGRRCLVVGGGVLLRARYGQYLSALAAVGAVGVHMLGNVGVILLLRSGFRRLRQFERLPQVPAIELGLAIMAVVWLAPVRLWQA